MSSEGDGTYLGFGGNGLTPLSIADPRLATIIRKLDELQTQVTSLQTQKKPKLSKEATLLRKYGPVEFLRKKGQDLNELATAAVRQAGGHPTALSRRHENEACLAFRWADELARVYQDKAHPREEEEEG